MKNNKKNKNLTILEAFKAMEDFLIKYYERTLSDDVGGLLSEIQILQDGLTEDLGSFLCSMAAKFR